MKKISVIVIAAICAMCLGLVACGGAPASSSAPSSSASAPAAAPSSSAPAESKAAPINDYVGTWKATKAVKDGEEYSVDEIFVDGWTMILNKDGSLEMTFNGNTAKGNWKEIKNGFNVKVEGALDVVVEKPGIGVMDYDGGQIYFEKQK